MTPTRFLWVRGGYTGEKDYRENWVFRVHQAGKSVYDFLPQMSRGDLGVCLSPLELRVHFMSFNVPCRRGSFWVPLFAARCRSLLFS